MRRQPGSWLRAELLKRGVLVSIVAVLLLGIMIGMLVHAWLPDPGFGTDVIALIYGAAAILLLAAVGPWSVRNIGKGQEAEARIGQALDYAIAAPGCAVAHNVTKIAKYGDIDHIVLTPARLWVVETKSGRVPRKEFRKALGRIAANVKAAREWMPNAEVQGCLALASGDVTERDEKGYEARGETILVMDRDSLWRTMRDEARTPQAADNADAQKVWALGKREE